MSFLSRLLGTKRTKIPTHVVAGSIDGSGDFALQIVGESHYQNALAEIVGGRTEQGAQLVVNALLIHEDDNPHDSQAVKVQICGYTVGYLNREDARSYRRQLQRQGIGGCTVGCKAMIVGGWYRGPDDWGHFGVRLDLPDKG